MKRNNNPAVVIAVANEHAGAIIGPRGSTLAGIRESSGCRVSVEPVPTPEQERLVQISGPAVDNVVNGLDAIVGTLLQAPRPATNITVLVPLHCVGPLIGKAGSQINQIREDSGAEVNIKDDSLRVLQTFTRCEVSGEPENVQAACRSISKVLYEQLHKENAPEFPDIRSLLNSMTMSPMGMMPPGYPPQGMMGYGYPPYGQPPYYGVPSMAPPRMASTASFEMLLPKRFLGHVIGKGGKYINNVRQQFSVDVKVDDAEAYVYAPTGEPAARITVNGARESVWPACAKCVTNLVTGGSNQQGEAEASQSETFEVDNSLVPRIIGKSGQRINLIRSSSRCRVTIEQPEEDSGEAATITVEGRAREIIGARMMIEGREVLTGTGSGEEGVMGAASTLELFVPKKYLGNIIGKSGKFINSVRQGSGCDIQVNDSAGVSDTSSGEELSILTVTGANSSISWAAAGQLMSCLHMGGNGNYTSEEAPLVETIDVPAESVGQIIGRAGARINLIRQSSGCRVNVEQAQEGGTAVVTLEGSPRQVQAARSLIQARESKNDGNGMGTDPSRMDSMAESSSPQMSLPQVGLGGIFGTY